MTKYTELYKKGYFKDRGANPIREAMYAQEFARLSKFIPKQGKVLDIGCGLGEFLGLFNNNWQKYGTEISEHARSIARKSSVNFNVPKKLNFFDLIIFRGTIQHLNNPLGEMEKRINQLKPGGLMVFLATPNAGSIYYRIFQELPMLDAKRNFFIPSDKTLSHILHNFGLKVKEIYYPYLETPYASPIKDHFYFILRLLGINLAKHAFWGNIVEIYAQKSRSQG